MYMYGQPDINHRNMHSMYALHVPLVEPHAIVLGAWLAILDKPRAW